MDTATVSVILKRVSLFAQFPDELIEQLSKTGDTTVLPAGTIICREGEVSARLFVVLEGQVRVYKHDQEGQPIELRRLGTGDFFGEVSLLDDKPRTASVECVSDCALLVIDQATVQGLLKRNPEITFGVLSALMRRMRDTIEQSFASEVGRQMIRAESELARHRSIAQMVAGVAHEVNTPLGILSTAASLIKHRLQHEALSVLNETEEGRYLIEDLREASLLIERNVLRAHKLVQEFKKVSVNQITDPKEKSRLAELVNDAVFVFQRGLKRTRLEIVVENQLPDGVGEWMGYPGSMTQVLLNLLSNIQLYAYPDGNGGKVRITLAMNQTGSAELYCIAIRDFGTGIPPENISRVFEPFFTTGRDKGGSGLGLAIVYTIVTSHLKGTIKIESTLGQGTCVTIHLPKVVAD